LYFIFIARMDRIEEYVEYQAGILKAIRKYGGTMSHHHGIGKATRVVGGPDRRKPRWRFCGAQTAL